MATSGLLDKLPLVEGGDKGVVLSADAINQIYALINMLAAPSLNPTSNIGAFCVSKGGYILDLSRMEQRIANLEARPYYTGATVNCIGNVATVTFTP